MMMTSLKDGLSRNRALRLSLATIASLLATNVVSSKIAAQEINGAASQNPQPQEQLPTLATPAMSKPSWALFDLSSTGKPLGDALANRGIYLFGSYTTDFAEVPVGGRIKGDYDYNQVVYGTDFDMNTLAHIPGLALHFTAVTRDGEKNNRGFSGASYEGFAIAGPAIATRLTELSVDQSLFNDHLRFLAGRLPAGAEYATSDLYCNFIAGICGNLAPWAWSRDSNAGYWPLASWGGRVTFKPTATTYVRLGVNEENPTIYSNAGWPWNNGWDTSKAVGVLIPWEVGYRTSFATDRYPRAFDVGGYIDTSRYADPYYNTKGTSVLLNGGTAVSHKGRAVVYAQAQQMIWKPSPDAKRGLNLFGGMLFGVHGIEQTEAYFLGGLVDVGPLASRPLDTLNFLAMINVLDTRYTQAYAASLASQGTLGVGAPSRNETTFELNYGALLAPGVQLKPFVEYVIHPDQIGFTPVAAKDQRALIVGAQFSIALNDATGLPSYIRKR